MLQEFEFQAKKGGGEEDCLQSQTLQISYSFNLNQMLTSVVSALPGFVFVPPVNTVQADGYPKKFYDKRSQIPIVHKRVRDQYGAKRI